MRNFKKYNINPTHFHIGYSFDISDEGGIYDISMPSLVDGSTATESFEQTMDETEKSCHIAGKITTLTLTERCESTTIMHEIL